MADIHERILQVLRRHPNGITIEGIREELGITGHQHLDRRVRELRRRFVISHSPGAGYVLQGPRQEDVQDDPVSLKLRAQILDLARGRCQMCGRTIAADDVQLQVDHKIPREWGGATEPSNLWAICSDCNAGKRDYFASFDAAMMRKVMRQESVHERLAETLRQAGPAGADASLLEFVAGQREWDRRLRELRDLGWEYRYELRTDAAGRRHTTFFLVRSVELPSDIRGSIQAAEDRRRRRT